MPTLDDGRTRRHVPASHPLDEGELDERTEGDGPDKSRPEARPRHQRGDHIPGSHTGRGDDQARSHYPKAAS